MPSVVGPKLGQELKRLEQLWIDSEFSLGKEELIAQFEGKG